MYRLITIGVKRLRDGVEIPFADGNVDYEEYKLWLADGNTPDPMTPPVWQDEALSELTARRDRLMEVVSGMQADYITQGDMANAMLCLGVKQGLKDIKTHPAILAVLSDPSATRLQFNAIALLRLRDIGAPASQAVKDEFRRYFTPTP